LLLLLLGSLLRLRVLTVVGGVIERKRSQCEEDDDCDENNGWLPFFHGTALQSKFLFNCDPIGAIIRPYCGLLPLKPQVAAIDARLIFAQNTGDSTYWTGLLSGFAALNPDATIVLISNTPMPPQIPKSENIRWLHLSGRSRWWSYVRFPLAARRMKAQAIHTQYSLSPLVGPNGFTTIHDVSFMIGPQWFKPLDRLVLRQTVPAAVRRAKKIFAVSETAKNELIQYFPRADGKTVVTYNACPPWIQRVPVEEARKRVADGLGIDGPYLLTVGTRWPRKNMRLAALAAGQTPYQLVVTGKPGWGPEELGKRGRAVGYVSNEMMSSLYSAADLYLAPSLHEGFGIPLLEAFRCECPVLCSSGGALPEVAGDAAVVESSWEPEVWAQRIEEILSDSSKIEHLRQAGARREKQFSWERTARLTLNAYFGASE
jgi:glycosyltransferase involved in cell wall biosynthesis